MTTLNTAVQKVNTFIAKLTNQNGNHLKHHPGLEVVLKAGIPVKALG